MIIKQSKSDNKWIAIPQNELDKIYMASQPGQKQNRPLKGADGQTKMVEMLVSNVVGDVEAWKKDCEIIQVNVNDFDGLVSISRIFVSQIKDLFVSDMYRYAGVEIESLPAKYQDILNTLASGLPRWILNRYAEFAYWRGGAITETVEQAKQYGAFDKYPKWRK